MYKLIEIINDVSLLNVTSNYITFKKENKLIINNKSIDINPLLWHIDEIHNLIWLKDNFWNNYVIDLATNKIKELEYNLAVGCVDKKYFIAFYNNMLSIFEVETFKHLGYFPESINSFKRCILKNNHLLLENSNIIEYFSLDHPKKPLWQFDLSQLGTFVDNYSKETKPYKVEKFIGIYANELLLACSGQKLLSIDIQAGKLLQTWDDVPADKMQLDKQAEKLIGLSDYLYAEVDLNTRETLVKNVKNNIEEAGLRAFKGGRDMPFTDTHIFYTAYGRDTKTDYLFDAVTAFNRHTYKIDWMYRIDASVGTNSPKIAGNKLYQLDLDGNLFIFEKKENV